ncbi:MAG TPA: hypothetical protein PK821_05505 [Victivallales bacterium]|nr:hypothetical protein [Victivallales bacterium]
MSRYNLCEHCARCDGKTCEADGKPVDKSEDTSGCPHFEEIEEEE